MKTWMIMGLLLLSGCGPGYMPARQTEQITIPVAQPVQTASRIDWREWLMLQAAAIKLEKEQDHLKHCKDVDAKINESFKNLALVWVSPGPDLCAAIDRASMSLKPSWNCLDAEPNDAARDARYNYLHSLLSDLHVLREDKNCSGEK